MEKKERDIVKLLYEENKENERLKVWWIQKKKQLGCRFHVSQRASKEFNIPLQSMSNAIIGYIEHLELENRTLKEPVHENFGVQLTKPHG